MAESCSFILFLEFINTHLKHMRLNKVNFIWPESFFIFIKTRKRINYKLVCDAVTSTFFLSVWSNANIWCVRKMLTFDGRIKVWRGLCAHLNIIFPTRSELIWSDFKCPFNWECYPFNIVIWFQCKIRVFKKKKLLFAM